ncbi:MAG: TIGR00266 family protein [Bdellovibrionales bacterium]|jgi:uncharacterized protein (TIGR00266 family)|nr:TIGR00266 family protein [Bdellovibrionales bacterium]
MENQVPRTNANVNCIGSSSFGMVKATIPPGGILAVEPGAMASQDVEIECQTEMNGDFLSALIARFLGGETFFINTYRNRSSSEKTIYFSQPTPGQIVERHLHNETIFLEPGSFIARSPSIRSEVKWAGFASFLAGEGLFRLCFTGTGPLWYGAYGAVIEKEIVGDYLVDSGHLLAYPPSVHLSVKLAGGLFSSFLSKEGIVLKLSGSGKIQLQTRSVKGLAQWLNPRFWG